MLPNDLKPFLTKNREFLEPLWIKTHKSWEDSPPIPPSKHLCRYTCLFLKETLKTSGYGEWEIISGRPIFKKHQGTNKGKYGYQTKEGFFYDHSWLVQGDTIIDLTADQFGGKPIVLSNVDNSSYRSNLNEEDIKNDLKALSNRTKQWIKQWYDHDKHTP